MALALLVGVAAVPVLAQPATANDDEPVTFTMALLNEVDSFNIFKGVEAPAYEGWALMYNMMIGYSLKDMSPIPELAETWESSDDGLTWTFHIRDGVTWSDGEPFSASDIAYTYNRVIDGGGESFTWGSYLSNVTTVTAPDDVTVLLELSEPNAALPLLPIPIIPEHIWKDVPEKGVRDYPNEPTDGNPVVGTGPFMLVEGTAGGSTYVYEKNPNYWGDPPHIDRVVHQVYKSEDPAIQAIIKGEVDFVHDITPLQVEALQGREGVHAQNGVSPYFEEIAFNTGATDPETNEPIGDGNPALKDARFRHALGYALDVDRLVESAYQGGAIAGDTIIPPTFPVWRWEPSEEEAFTFDLEKAGQLLDEAGYKLGSDGLRTMPDGSPIGKLRLIARPEEQRSVTIMDFFKEWLAEIGIESEVTVMESGRLTNVILEGNYDAFHWGWYVEADPDGVLSYFTCEQRGGLSDSWYCNEEYDALDAAQNVELDRSKRIEIVHQMQQMIFEESPYLVTAYTVDGQALRTDHFACFEPQPTPGGTLLIQYGGYNYTFMRPADEAGDCDGSPTAIGAAQTAQEPGSSDEKDGSNTGLLVGLGVLVAVLAAGGGFLAVRRRGTADERE